MKKYFLLATTALLLNTSNVMANIIPVDTLLEISVDLKQSASVEVEQHADFGTIYMGGGDDASFTVHTPWADIAKFENGMITVDSEYVAHNVGGQVGIIKVIRNEAEGVIEPTLSSNYAVLSDGVNLEEARLVVFGDEENGVQRYMLEGTLVVNMLDHQNGSGFGSLTVSINYE